jgi:hypothetical protein
MTDNTLKAIKKIMKGQGYLTCLRRVWRYQKGQSESVYRRTDNTMAKRKSTKGQTTINKILWFNHKNMAAWTCSLYTVKPVLRGHFWDK